MYSFLSCGSVPSTIPTTFCEVTSLNTLVEVFKVTCDFLFIETSEIKSAPKS